LQKGHASLAQLAAYGEFLLPVFAGFAIAVLVMTLRVFLSGMVVPG
jgi:hypothetical protein